MTSWSSKKIPCPICGVEIAQGNRARHIKNNHPEHNPYKPTSRQHSSSLTSSFKGVVKEGHPDEDVSSSDDNISETNEPEPKRIYQETKRIYQEPKQIYQEPKRIYQEPRYNPYIYKPKPESNQHVKHLNERINQVINNFNGHLKKIYSQKANKDDLYILENKIRNFSSTIEGIKRTLTEQHRAVRNIDMVYKHSKKSNTNYSRNIQKKIDNVVKSKNINDSTENTLKRVRIMIEAHKLSIERSYKLIENLTDEVSLLKTKMNSMEMRVKSIENTNNIIIKSQKNLFQQISSKKTLSKEDVINIVKQFLKTYKGGNTLLEEPKKETPNELQQETPNELQQETPKEPKHTPKEKPLNSFSIEINELLRTSKTKKNKQHYKYTIDKVKKIIKKHVKMGHLNEIEEFSKNTKNKINKHIKKTIKNIKIK
jgi:hypothetical protein